MDELTIVVLPRVPEEDSIIVPIEGLRDMRGWLAGLEFDEPEQTKQQGDLVNVLDRLLS